MTQKLLIGAGVLVAVSVGVGFGVARWTEPGAPVDARSAGTVSLEKFVQLEARASRLEAELARARAELAARPVAPIEATRTVSEETATEAAPVENDGHLDFDWVMEKLRERDFGAFEGIPSAEEIEATLEKHGRAPAYLVAASLLADDPEQAIAYLEEALEKDPDSPAALARAAQILTSEGIFDEAFKEFVDRLKESDPSNALGSYYEALWHFETGDAERGIEALREGSAITHLRDYSVHHLPVLETFYREAVGTESVAKILTAIGTRLDSLVHLRDIARWSGEEAAARAASGHPEEAIEIQREAAELGGKLSAASRWLVQDLVGIAVEKNALESMKTLLGQLGRTEGIAEIDRRLLKNAQRSEEGKRAAKVTERAFGELGEAELIEYFERMALEGETSAARRLRGRDDQREP